MCESQAWLKPVKRKPQEDWSGKFQGGKSVKPPKLQYAFTHNMLALTKIKTKWGHWARGANKEEK